MPATSVKMCKFVFVLVLVGFAAAAQVPTPAPTKAPFKAPAKVSPKAVANLPNRGTKQPGGVSLRSPFGSDGRNDRQIITTRFSGDGAPEKQCECVEFFLCPEGKSYDLAANGINDKCGNENYICCEEVKQSTSGSDSGFASGGAPKTEALKDPEGKECSCVAFDQCHNEAYVKDYGAGTIQIRISPCDTTQICCPHEYLTSNKPSPVPETPHGGYTETSHGGYSETPHGGYTETSHGGYTETSHGGFIGGFTPAVPDPKTDYPVHVTESPQHMGFSPSVSEYNPHTPTEYPNPHVVKTTPNPEECACVPFHQCKNDTYDHDYGRGIILARSQFCDVSELCCPLDYIIKPVPLEYPPTPNPSEHVPQEVHYECGISKEISTRFSAVLDKTSTVFGEFPWMIMILKKIKEDEKEFACGGSLLSAHVVLTAAHCVKGIDKDVLVVRGGEYDVHLKSTEEPAPHQDKLVHDIIIHPFYHPDVLFNDMALIVLREPFELKPHIIPICSPLPESKFADPSIYDPDKCIATGWGKDLHGAGGSYQTTLKKVELGLVDSEECEKKLKSTKLGPRFKLHASFLCAGGQLGKDTCQGDGGGPLFCALHENPNRFVQVGIVSWGLGCGDQYPAVYASLYANQKWLSVELNLLSNSLSSRNNLIDIRKPESDCPPKKKL